jgi:hypothetical protein
MAKRIIFLPTKPTVQEPFTEILIEFDWVPGMSISQGRKSVQNLHSSASKDCGLSKILEISTRSSDPFGISLSAFNLQLTYQSRKYSVEALYQGSKVFRDGGPFLDILSSSSIQAKQDSRLKDSGPLEGFRFEETEWPLNPSPNFYDYLYIRALLENEDRIKLLDFDAFSDIAYNQTSLAPKVGKSFNCQARSAAIYVTLMGRMSEESILEWLIQSGKNLQTPMGQLDLF